MIIRFNDNNQAEVYYGRGFTTVFYLQEVDRVKDYIKSLPVDSIEILVEEHVDFSRFRQISVKFKNKADEAYFKVLCSDEIQL